MSSVFLRQVLRPELIRMHLEANTKVDAIHELIGVLDAAGLLCDRDEAERVVSEREKVMSTGMELGIAIPHGKTDTVDGLLAAVALKPEGMDFACVDGQLARIVIITLSPASRSGPHIRFMAEISKLLRSEQLRRKILEASSPEEVMMLLTGDSN